MILNYTLLSLGVPTLPKNTINSYITPNHTLLSPGVPTLPKNGDNRHGLQRLIHSTPEIYGFPITKHQTIIIRPTT